MTLPEEVDVGDYQKAFATFDDFEAAQYHQISRGRLEIIQRFIGVAEKEKERLIQQYLFDHLWLLDPSWERIPTTSRMEEGVKKEFGSLDAELTEDEAGAGGYQVRNECRQARRHRVEALRGKGDDDGPAFAVEEVP